MDQSKKLIAELLKKLSHFSKLSQEDIESLIEVPPSPEMGDYAFPCFSLAKELKMNPILIATKINSEISSSKLPNYLEKIETKGAYLNFFLNKEKLSTSTLEEIKKQKDKYGSSQEGKGKTIVVEFSSPNIAKPFGIGHLRSTIIGNAISYISQFNGYKVVRMNYLGDWGTPFGKIIEGYIEFGDEKKLKADPIKHLLDIYVKTSKSEKYEQLGRDRFKLLEQGDKKTLALWKKFRELSIKDFEKVYGLLNVKFDDFSGESLYDKKMGDVVKLIETKKLLVESEGAKIIDLEKYDLGVILIKKSDNSTLYATRDLAAAIDRHQKYNFNKMFYEVGQEQQLHFRQIFKALELLGYDWAKNCTHVSHGLYLDADGKKFATRKGKTVFMEDIFKETQDLVKKELSKREKLSKKELEDRSLKITRAAIIYGDLKNYRENNMIFDIDRFISFEGNTGPYLLYSYARASSIIRKSKSKNKIKIDHQEDSSKESQNLLIKKLSEFPEIVSKANKDSDPSLVSNYSYDLAKLFNEFYHSSQVIGSSDQDFKIKIVESFRQVLKNSLALLGIDVIEEM
ncbi:arginine--tRNA ligase [Candidatus Pacearchaeota archaeon CG10_big_fil_rev_8_21_14_0_10_32_14]|nr:MAG: arginine--tRNA ligase [Candidatus Pacearchaeota archaeon CG10_big_fil_rev_8_21_14_0_10_32_14]